MLNKAYRKEMTELLAQGQTLALMIRPAGCDDTRDQLKTTHTVGKTNLVRLDKYTVRQTRTW